jgi:hypothetical protein
MQTTGSRAAGKPGVRNQTMTPGRRGVVGDGMVGRFDDVKQGDLSGTRLRRAGVRGAMVAAKPGNAG